jgi:membrane protein DedA with SNARE-associated domain
MQEWIINVLNHFGYIGIALLIAIENIFPPIPSEIILTFGGFMTTQSNMNIWLVALSATIGSVAGAIILYGIGRLVSPQRLTWLLDKWGRILRIKKSDLIKAEDWFIRHGNSTVFLCRFIPIVRSLISIPAGMARMKIGKFLFYTILGTAIWNTVLIYLGALAGENWKSILTYLNTYSYIAGLILAVLGICFVAWFIKKRTARGKSTEDD